MQCLLSRRIVGVRSRTTTITTTTRTTTKSSLTWSAPTSALRPSPQHTTLLTSNTLRVVESRNWYCQQQQEGALPSGFLKPSNEEEAVKIRITTPHRFSTWYEALDAFLATIPPTGPSGKPNLGAGWRTWSPNTANVYLHDANQDLLKGRALMRPWTRDLFHWNHSEIFEGFAIVECVTWSDHPQMDLDPHIRRVATIAWREQVRKTQRLGRAESVYSVCTSSKCQPPSSRMITHK